MASATANRAAFGLLVLLSIAVVCWFWIFREVGREEGAKPGFADPHAEVVPSQRASTVASAPEHLEVGVLPAHAPIASAVRPMQIARSLDWNVGKGSLGDQVIEAMKSQNGEMAFDLALKIRHCGLLVATQAFESSRGANPQDDAAVVAVRQQRIQDENQLISRCQTISGDQAKIRLALIDIAVRKGVDGAAAESFGAGSRRSDVLGALVEDASRGNVPALYYVAANSAATIGVSEDRRDVFRYALKLASEDREVGGVVMRWYTAARLDARAFAQDSEAVFDFSRLSGESKVEAKLIAERLVARIKQSSS